MTDQTRYRIVCADGEARHWLKYGFIFAETGSLVRLSDAAGCGPHTVEPVEPVAPDPTCAQSSCIHCRNGKPDACPVRPYPGTVGT